MAKIFLVCTVHEESGSATSTQLHAILNAINPDVLFLEAPSETSENDILSVMNNNLESNAIKLFQTHSQVTLVPVDLPTPNRDFFENYYRLHAEVKSKSAEYRQLMDVHSERVCKHGFYYLNSEIYSEDMLAIDNEVDAQIVKTGTDILKAFNAKWHQQNALRDNAMYGNILKYCVEHTFNKAVFLVGAGHRAKIIELSKFSEFEWNYDGKGYWYPEI